MKTMSDFIMEQEITTSSANDEVEIMEGFMRVQAIGAVAECYCEHAAIAAFSEENGLSVFSESDSVGKKMWEGVKAFFENIWEWLKALVKGVINIFTKSSIERCIAALKARQDENSSNFNLDIEPAWVDAEKVLAIVERFGAAVEKGAEGFSGESTVKSFKDEAEAFLKKYKEDKKNDFGGAQTVGASYIISVLERLNKANIPSRGSKLLKEFGFKKDNFKKAGDDKKVDKEMIKEIKKAAGLLAKVYDKYVDTTVKLVKKALNKDIKADELKSLQAKNSYADKAAEDADDTSDARAKAHKQESYAENSDGYFFL